MPAESLSRHIQRMSLTFKDILSREHADGDADKTEAMWYEPWGHILHDLRQRTNFDVTVAAQDRLTLVAVVNKDDPKVQYEEEWSMQGNTSLSDTDDTEEYILARYACIPDFVIYYTPSINFLQRRIPVIVEIKPPRRATGHAAGSPYSVRMGVELMIPQTFSQARHAFERSPHTSQIDILCVVGPGWWMYTLDYSDLPALPIKQLQTKIPRLTMDLLASKRAALNIAALPPGLPQLMNDNRTDYSDSFKAIWTGMCSRQCIGVPSWV